MTNKEAIGTKKEPLRHGWGGDLKKRDRALKDKEEDRREREDFLMNDKFNNFSATEKDYLLLEEMVLRK
jgi:hypothetical protein